MEWPLLDGSDSSRPLVLVVDDEKFMRTLASEALEQEGYSVLAVASGDEALESFARHRPRLVMLDLHMPGRDGLSTCRELRRRPGGDRLPILVVTGTDDRSAVDAAYDAGATDFVSKPVNWPLLGHRVRYLLRSSQAFSDLELGRISLENAQRIARLGSWEWDTDTNEMRWSHETFRILAMDSRESPATHHNFWCHLHPEDRDFVGQQIDVSLRAAKGFEVEPRLLLPGGAVRHVHVQGEFIHDEARSGNWVAGTIQDVTERVQAQQKIRFLADFDPLTGLLNRRRFRAQLGRAVHEAGKAKHCLGLLFMDLDRFKRINDTLGHAAGDEVLAWVAQRLREQVRGGDVVARSDADELVPAVSRFGGDEFTVLLSKISCPEDSARVARRILAALDEPVPVAGRKITLGVSIGIATFPRDAEDVDTLMHHADAALYHAKEQGRGNVQFFLEALNESSVRKLALETQLADALDQDELQLHYQPRQDLASGRVVGMEALLRWRNPELGVVPPKDFIPVAEESGLIVPIGEWVVRTACAQNRAWQEAGYERVCVSVNVSPRQFAAADLVEVVTRALRDAHLDPRDLEIELTESVLLQDDESTATALRDLRAIGVKVALDDFGTGYSSLSYLSRFPLDTLKMDRCFVRDVHADPGAAGVAHAVIGMAHALGLRVVAEGVDSEDQAALLRQQGCDEVQGFLFSGAVCADDFVRFLSREEGRR